MTSNVRNEMQKVHNQQINAHVKGSQSPIMITVFLYYKNGAVSATMLKAPSVISGHISWKNLIDHHIHPGHNYKTNLLTNDSSGNHTAFNYGDPIHYQISFGRNILRDRIIARICNIQGTYTEIPGYDDCYNQDGYPGQKLIDIKHGYILCGKLGCDDQSIFVSGVHTHCDKKGAYNEENGCTNLQTINMFGQFCPIKFVFDNEATMIQNLIGPKHIPYRGNDGVDRGCY